MGITIIDRLKEVISLLRANGEKGYNAAADAHTVATLQKKKRYLFAGTTLDTTDWEVVTQGTGTSYTVSGGNLILTSGTTANAELVIQSVDSFTIPSRLLARIASSQKIANTEFAVGFVSEDGTDVAELLYSYAQSTAAVNITTSISNLTTSKATSVAASYGTTPNYFYEMDATDEEITTSYKGVDTLSSSKTGLNVINSSILNPNNKYKVRIRLKNLASAPASSTTHTVQQILCLDTTELTAEITGGRGNLNTNNAVPVSIANQSVVGITGVPTVSLRPTSTAGDGSFNKLISAATTNATSVKTSAGVIIGGLIQNTTATVAYFKLYNKASAPTVGTDTPVLTIVVPANSTITLGDVVGTYGAKFTTGIAYAITGASSDTDTTAVAAGAVVVGMSYI